MYSSHPHFILGFHGCDRSLAEDVLLARRQLRSSQNTYDWLGHGIYFWENSPARALDYARAIQKHPGRCTENIHEPFVIGAIIDLGRCLDLIDPMNLALVRQGYELLKASGTTLPRNTSIDRQGDLLLRKLDCAVIETVHAYNDKQDSPPFDSVRGMFWEGQALYQNAGFREKNHIQVCVRNPNCIKGYFSVLAPVEGWCVP